MQIFRAEEETPRNLLMNFDLITITSGRSFGRHQIRLEDVPTQTPSWVGGLSLSFLWIRKRKGGRLFLYYNLCKDGVFSVGGGGEGPGKSSRGFLGICIPSSNPDHKIQQMVLHVTEMSAWQEFLCIHSLGSCVASVTWTKEEYKQTRLPLGYV